MYWTTDLATYLPDLVARPEILRFFGGGEEPDDDPATAPMVRLVGSEPGSELGVAYASIADLARAYRTAAMPSFSIRTTRS